MLPARLAPARWWGAKKYLLHGERIAAGGRNDTLMRVGCYLRKFGAELPDLLRALRALNRLRCDPPLPEGEPERVAHSIMRYTPDTFSRLTVDRYLYMIEETDAKTAQDTK